MTFPWEQLPAVRVEDTVKLLQQDFAYAVQYTAVMVRSSRPELQIVVNTPRGQIIPRGVCKFSDGTTTEFQDIGMPRPNVPTMNIEDLMAQVWEIAKNLGLELS